MKLCKTCGRSPLTIQSPEDGAVVRNLLNAGREQVWFKCSCGGKSDYLNAYERSQVTITLIHDRRCQACLGDGCEACSHRCEVYGCDTPWAVVELHHSAPVSIFGNEADFWPRYHLCRRHHEEWHQRTQCAIRKTD